MSPRLRTAALLAGLVISAAVLLILYQQLWSPQARIKAVMKKTCEAFLVKDRAAIVKNLDPGFQLGAFDRARADTALAALFREFDRVKVVLNDQQVKVSGGTAIDSVKLVVIVGKGGEQGFLLGSIGNPARLAVRFRRDGKWRIAGVEGLPEYN